MKSFSCTTVTTVFAMAFLLLADPVVALEASTSTSTSASTSASTSSGMISFPLIPHHVHRRRLGVSEQDDERNMAEHEDLRSVSGSRRNLSDNANAIMGGLYMGYGTHYVDLWCGSPPQRQTVIVDTGSSQTAFPCQDCKDCGSDQFHVDTLFQESKSSTFQSKDCDTCSQRSTCNEDNDRCEIEQFYSEGSSWTAYEAIDTCYIGGYHNTGILNDNNNVDNVDPGHAAAFAIDANIGCQTEVTGLFKTQLADGIMGMCDGKQAFWHQMFRAHAIRQKVFSLCYTRPPHALKEGSEAGAITLGGTDERLHDKSPMVFTTIAGTSSEYGENEGKSGYYDIHVREMYLREGRGGDSATSAHSDAVVIKLNGAAAINDEGGVIVDSGTTDTYFSEVIKTQLQKNWELLSHLTWGHDKISLTQDEFAKLPTLLIQFAGDEEMNRAVAEAHGNGEPNNIAGLAGDLDKNYPYDVVIAVPASHYMEALSDGTVTNRVYDTETDGSVLGANAMVGHDVMFDAQNMRLGWAESSCDYSGLVLENDYISAMAEVYESQEDMEKEDDEEESEENEKEKFDEENTEEEIEQDNENIEEFIGEGGSVTEFDDSKTSNNIEIPVDDIIANPAFAGVGFAILFLGGIFCVRMCCFPKKSSGKRRRRNRNRKQREIEMSQNDTGLDSGLGNGYKDDVVDDYTNNYDDDESDNYSDEYDDAEEEYGIQKHV